MNNIYRKNVNNAYFMYCQKKIALLYLTILLLPYKNKDKNVQRYAVRGEKDRERDRDREKERENENEREI